MRKSSARPWASLRHQVGRGRRDHQQFVLLRDARCARWRASMANRSVRTLRPVRAAKVSGRTNSSRGGGHHHLHLVAVLHQQAGQFRGLISRDAAADAEEDLHADLEDGARVRSGWLRAPGR